MPNDAADSRMTYPQQSEKAGFLPMSILHMTTSQQMGSLTCAFDPPIPKLFTATLSSRSVGHGMAFVGTLSFA